MRLLRANRSFRVLWTANLVASLTGWTLGIAVSVHVFNLTGSPLATATLLVATTVPAIVLGSVGGVVADRVDRVRLLKVVSWLRVAAVAAVLLVGDHPAGLYAVAFVQAALMQFFIPAEQATVADVVSDSDLPEAMSANSVAGNVTRLAGPALGGVMVTLIGFRSTSAVIVAALIGAAILLGLLRGSKPPSTHSPARSVVADWLDGLRVLVRHRPSRAVATLQILDSVKEGPFTSLFPVIMLGTIGTTSAYMGIVNSSFAVTSVIAAPLVTLAVRRLGYRRPIAIGASVSGLLLLLLACWPTELTALGCFLLSGFPFTISWVAANTWLLRSTTASHRGRVTGAVGTLNAAAIAAFAALAGAAAEIFPVVVVLGVAALFQVAAGPVFLIMTRRAAR